MYPEARSILNRCQGLLENDHDDIYNSTDVDMVRAKVEAECGKWPQSEEFYRKCMGQAILKDDKHL